MSTRQKVGFLSGIPTKTPNIPHFAKEEGRIARKKLLNDAPYTSSAANTFRVLGERAEYETSDNWETYRTIPRPLPPDTINEPFSRVPYPLKETSVHHIPHSRTAAFIRTNVRFINKPVWVIEPTVDETASPRSQLNQLNEPISNSSGIIAPRDFYSASYIGQPGTNQSEPIESTYKGDFVGHNLSKINTRHGSNFEILNPAYGIIPVNELREKDGKQRLWEEKISYRHIYDSRANPNYPFGLKKQGAFVWDRYMHEPPIAPNLIEQQVEPNVVARTTPTTRRHLVQFNNEETITPTSNWPDGVSKKRIEVPVEPVYKPSVAKNNTDPITIKTELIIPEP